VSVKDIKHDSFLLVQNKTPVSTVAVHQDTRFIFVDDKRALTGFEGMTYRDYYVRPVGRAKWPVIEAELAELIKAANIEGVPTIKLSSLPWHAPSYVRKSNLKHRIKLFRFNPEESYSKPYSNCWLIEDHVPSADDVFVVINNFKTDSYKPDLGAAYREDERLATLFEATLPAIYGYKSTEKKPVDEKACLGTSYWTWRETFAASLMTPKTLELLELFHWKTVLTSGHYGWSPHKDAVKIVTKHLGAGHPVTLAFQKCRDAEEFFEKSNDRLLRVLRELELRVRLPLAEHQAEREIEVISKKYPLLALVDARMSMLYESHAAEWANYIKLVDNS
jgi:hypothetical protein